MTPSINKSTLLSAAKQYLIKHPTRSLSEATHAQYEKEFLNIMKNCGSIASVIQKISNTRKKSTFYKRKYASQGILSEKIQDLLLKIEATDDDDAEQEGLDLLDLLLTLAKEVQELRICAIDRLPRKSKRQDIRDLPADWREQLLHRMRRSANYLPALVSAVCGCRPEELKKGISVTIDANKMVIHICGAKVADQKGQPTRTIEYPLPSTNKLVSALAESINSEDGTLKISINNPNSFGSSIKYFGQQTFPSRRKAITPYCLRHAFANDIKRQLGDNDAVSQALGHQADSTRSSYGQAQMGKAGGGGLAPDKISATHSVRHVKSPLPDLTPAPSL